MPLTAFLLALASAVLHALWNVLLKRCRDLDAASAGVFFVALVTAGTASLLVPGRAFPGAAAVGWGVAAGVCEGCYFLGLARSLERASLGWSYSWMRGSSIVLVWPVSILCLGEVFRLLSLACAACVCLGLGLLARQEGGSRPSGIRPSGIRPSGVRPSGVRQPGALRWALLTGACIAGYNLFYKQALSNGAQPLALFALSMAVGLPIQTGLRLRQSRRVPFKVLPERPGLVLLAGVLCTLGFALFLEALARTGAGAVTTIRNTSIAFAVLFSLALGERPGPAHWLGAGLITLGAIGLGWG